MKPRHLFSINELSAALDDATKNALVLAKANIKQALYLDLVTLNVNIHLGHCGKNKKYYLLSPREIKPTEITFVAHYSASPNVSSKGTTVLKREENYVRI